EANKKTQEHSRNSEPSLMPSARSQSTANGCSVCCCPIANTLISAVVCTLSIGTSSYMGLISASSACALFLDPLHVSCSFDFVPAKKRCMVSLRKLHSHLKRLSQNDLQGSQTENGFKRAFVIIFGQDLENFTGTMFFNVEQLEKQLDKEGFQELGSMAAFNVLETQF
nr:hypothetical protein [Tanacetum cinerariifolium]